jgi:hypothetical protein
LEVIIALLLKIKASWDMTLDPENEGTAVLRKRLKLLVEPHSGGVVVKALRYKPAGHGFDSRWCHWNFSVT